MNEKTRVLSVVAFEPAGVSTSLRVEVTMRWSSQETF